MFILNHGYICDVIDSCVTKEHCTTCYCWIKNMYNKSMITLTELGEYADIICEKEIVLGSENNTIAVCMECDE